MQDALCETTYQAEVAGLVCYVSPEGGASLAVRLDGFSHRLPALAAVVFRTLATLKACTFSLGHEPMLLLHTHTHTLPRCSPCSGSKVLARMPACKS